MSRTLPISMFSFVRMTSFTKCRYSMGMVVSRKWEKVIDERTSIGIRFWPNIQFYFLLNINLLEVQFDGWPYVPIENCAFPFETIVTVCKIGHFVNIQMNCMNYERIRAKLWISFCNSAASHSIALAQFDR